jgi:hypothetical protein
MGTLQRAAGVKRAAHSITALWVLAVRGKARFGLRDQSDRDQLEQKAPITIAVDLPPVLAPLALSMPGASPQSSVCPTARTIRPTFAQSRQLVMPHRLNTGLAVSLLLTRAAPHSQGGGVEDGSCMPCICENKSHDLLNALPGTAAISTAGVRARTTATGLTWLASAIAGVRSARALPRAFYAGLAARTIRELAACCAALSLRSNGGPRSAPRGHISMPRHKFPSISGVGRAGQSGVSTALRGDFKLLWRGLVSTGPRQKPPRSAAISASIASSCFRASASVGSSASLRTGPHWEPSRAAILMTAAWRFSFAVAAARDNSQRFVCASHS